MDPRKSVSTFRTTYRGSSSVSFLETFFSPLFLTQGVLPPATVQYGRILYPNSGIEGTVAAGVSAGGQGPWVTVQVTNPRNFDMLALVSPSLFQNIDEDEEPRPHLPRRSLMAFTRGNVFSQYGLTFAGIESRISAEWGVNFEELSFELRAGAHLRPTQDIEWNVTGIYKWNPKDSRRTQGVLIPGQHENTLSAAVALTIHGVNLNLEYVLLPSTLYFPWLMYIRANYLGQRFKVPILLCVHSNDTIALWFSLIPATATAIYYSFIAKPRQRAQRARWVTIASRLLDVTDSMTSILRDARAKLKDPSFDPSREAAEITALLADTATRHMRTEAACEGPLFLSQCVLKG